MALANCDLSSVPFPPVVAPRIPLVSNNADEMNVNCRCAFATPHQLPAAIFARAKLIANAKNARTDVAADSGLKCENYGPPAARPLYYLASPGKTFIRHMSQRERHEIAAISRLISRVCVNTRC